MLNPDKILCDMELVLLSIDTPLAYQNPIATFHINNRHAPNNSAANPVHTPISHCSV